jgi:phosphoribosylformylglycinamidine cyclo-ligase
MSDAEAYGTFNMGAGFVLFAAPNDVARATAIAQGAGYPLLRVGAVEPGPKRVVIEPLGITFEGDALRIR